MEQQELTQENLILECLGRINKGASADVALPLLDECIEAYKQAMWEGMTQKRTSAELYNLNSISTVFGIFRTYLKKVSDDGKVAELEIKESNEQ